MARPLLALAWAACLRPGIGSTTVWTPPPKCMHAGKFFAAGDPALSLTDLCGNSWSGGLFTAVLSVKLAAPVAGGEVPILKVSSGTVDLRLQLVPAEHGNVKFLWGPPTGDTVSLTYYAGALEGEILIMVMQTADKLKMAGSLSDGTMYWDWGVDRPSTGDFLAATSLELAGGAAAGYVAKVMVWNLARSKAYQDDYHSFLRQPVSRCRAPGGEWAVGTAPEALAGACTAGFEGGEMSVAFTFRDDVAGGGHGIIVKASAGNGNYLQADVDKSKMYWTAKGDGGATIVQIPYEVGKTYRFLLRKSFGYIEIYTDGDNEAWASAPTTAGSFDIEVGSDTFAGAIKDIWVWHRAVTLAQAMPSPVPTCLQATTGLEYTGGTPVDLSQCLQGYKGTLTVAFNVDNLPNVVTTPQVLLSFKQGSETIEVSLEVDSAGANSLGLVRFGMSPNYVLAASSGRYALSISSNGEVTLSLATSGWVYGEWTSEDEGLVVSYADDSSPVQPISTLDSFVLGARDTTGTAQFAGAIKNVMVWHESAASDLFDFNKNWHDRAWLRVQPTPTCTLEAASFGSGRASQLLESPCIGSDFANGFSAAFSLVVREFRASSVALNFTSGATQQLVVMTNANGTFTVSVRTGGHSFAVLTPQVSLGQWYRFLVTLKISGHLQVWIDGLKVAEIKGWHYHDHQVTPWCHVGGMPDGTAMLDGDFEQLWIWNSATVDWPGAAWHGHGLTTSTATTTTLTGTTLTTTSTMTPTVTSTSTETLTETATETGTETGTATATWTGTETGMSTSMASGPDDAGGASAGSTVAAGTGAVPSPAPEPGVETTAEVATSGAAVGAVGSTSAEAAAPDTTAAGPPGSTAAGTVAMADSSTMWESSTTAPATTTGALSMTSGEATTPVVPTTTPAASTETPAVPTATPVATPAALTTTPAMPTTAAAATTAATTATQGVAGGTTAALAMTSGEATTPVVPTTTPAALTATPAVPTATPAATPAAPTTTPAMPTTAAAVTTATPAVLTATPAPTSTPASLTATSAAPSATPVTPTATPPTSTAAMPTTTPAAATATSARPVPREPAARSTAAPATATPREAPLSSSTPEATAAGTTTTLTTTTSRSSTTATEAPARTPQLLVEMAAKEEAGLLAGLFAARENVSRLVESEGAKSLAVRLLKGSDEGAAPVVIPVQGTEAKVTVPASSFAALGEAAVLVSVFRAAALEQLESGEAGGGSVETLAAVSVDFHVPGGGGPLRVEDLAEPIRVKMPGVNASLRNRVRCAFWEEAGKFWSYRGLQESWDADGGLVCLTKHLSLFAAILQGFLDAFKCSQLTLLTAAALKELTALGWLRTPIALCFWSLLGALALLMALACRLDARRSRTWRDEFFLIPHPKVENGGQERREEAKASPGCLQRLTGSGGGAAPAVEAKEEEGGRCRRLLRGVLDQLVMLTLKKQASATLWLSDEVVDFVLKNRDFRRAMSEGCVDSSSERAKDTAWIHLHSSVTESMKVEWQRLKSWWSVLEVAAIIFWQVCPVVSVFLWCPFKTSSLRLLLLADKVFGSLMVGALFFQASGEFPEKARPVECRQDSIEQKIGRIIAIGVASTLLAALPCMMLSQLHARQLQRTEFEEDAKDFRKLVAKWRRRDKLLWLLGLLYLGVSAFFVLLFVANIHPDDQVPWGFSGLTSVIKDQFFVPAVVSIALPFLAVAALLSARAGSALVSRTQAALLDAGVHHSDVLWI